MAGIFSVVLIASFWGGCITVLFLLVNKLFKKALPASWHYHIWFVVIVRLLFPVFITVSVEPAIIDQYKNVLQTETPANTTDDTERMTATQIGDARADEQIISPSAENTAINMVDRVFQVNDLWMIWFVISVVLIAYKFLSYFLYARKLRIHCVLPSQREMNVFFKRKGHLNVRRNVAFFKNKGAQTPIAMGLFNLAIILPDKEYSDTRLDYIVHHELTHIKRRDIGVKWLYEIVKAVHWFNPLVYIAAKNSAFYCEISCDAEVLKDKTTNQRKEYSMTILNLISQAINPKTPMCVSMHSGKANLKKRIQYILNNGQSKKNIGLATAIAMIIFAFCACSSVQLQETPRSPQQPEPMVNVETPMEKTVDPPIHAKEKTNILIAGIDDSGEFGNADTIIVASFDAATNYISLLSVPRDTYLSPSEATVSGLKQQGIEIPPDIKLGQLTAYAQTDGMESLQKEISNTLGIPIDYYIKMDSPAFKKIVDAAGGVNMTIPEGGLYYIDPMQDLEISLDEGLQHLDGEKAMMLVRYRHTYKQGDLDRIGVQQQFLQAIYSKIMNGDNLIEKSTTFLSVLIENTETNLTLNDIASYLRYIPKMSADSMQTFQLPLGTEEINSILYVVFDKEVFESSVADIFR
jgi:LCP family protein required for cell wall assembly